MTSRKPAAKRPLRERAEARLAGLPVDATSDALTLLHELQVHQIELQMQNEELVASHEALAAAMQRQRLLYDDAPVGYCTVEADGTIIEANNLACSLLNCARGALMGHRLGDLLSAEGAQGLQALLHDTAAWPSLNRCEVVARAGSPGDPASVSSPLCTLQIDARRGPDGQSTLLALVDISERKRANEALSIFFAQMNHELRTPLNAILGFSHLLRRQLDIDSNDTLARWVNHIERAGLHTLALVADGLDMARIEAGRVEAKLEPVRLDAALAQALVLVASSASAQQISIGLAADSRTGLQALATPRLLHQILLNLLSNAIKYNRPGGTVQLSLRAESGQVILEVADTGQGLSAEQMSRLFHPFDRLGAEHGSTEGTGLGLLISRRLAEAMKGALALRSEAGVGTTASLVLTACA
jgi:signal transduction histidine kinase